MAALTKILMEQEKKKVVVLFRTCADLRLVERLCQAMNIYTFAVHIQGHVARSKTLRALAA
ncbi:uncharacterized protein LOC144162540 isoform X5 [Haemaphysalis longicornis]